MRFTEEELAQIYDYVAERLITAGVLQPKLAPPAPVTTPVLEERPTPKLGDRPFVESGPKEPKAVSETMSENIRVPSYDTIKAHTMEWTQAGKPSN